MKKITLWLLCLCIGTTLGFAQTTFTDAGGPYDMQNGNGGTAATCGTVDELNLPLTVSGVGTLDATTILQSVTFNATHTWNSDITVSLQDPSGTTTILLIDGIGGSGDGFTDCILSDAATTALPTTATPVVTGTFLPLTALSSFDGLNADGDWILNVCDGANGDTGNVTDWSLTFGPPPPPANDECVDAIALDCTNNSASGNSSASIDGEVWYSFTGTVVGDNVTVSLCGSGFDTILDVYDACGGTLVASNDDSCGLQSELSFTSDGVTTYAISVRGFNGATGNYDINIACNSSLVPTNNDCLSAEAIDCNDTVIGTTVAASDSDANGNLDVWYSYTGTVVGDNVTASLCGSGFDTIITVFDACGGTEVTSNDDSCGLQSEVSWASDGVTTYLIRVEGFNGASGDYELSFLCDSESPPANDECANAETIVCGGQYIGDTTFASDEGDDDPGECGTTAGTGGAVWYTFVGANSNNAGAAAGSVGDEVTLDLSLSTFDTKIRVFTGVCGDLTCLDGDDDGGAGLTSLITFPTTVGTVYYVLVHGFSDNAGEYTLDVSCVAPATCSAAVTDGGVVEETCNPDGTGSFVVNIEVTDAGDAGSVFDDGTNTYPVVAGTVTAGPYNSGDSVTIELVALDPDCSSTVGTFEFTCPPPAPENDDAAGAINLPVGDTVCETVVFGTNIGATTSVENDTEASCSSSDPSGDVWFKVMVPFTGELTIEVSASTLDPIIADTVMEVYSGTSGALVEIECDDDDGDGLLSRVDLTGLTPGEVLLVRVWEWQDNFKGNFNICAWSPTTLGVENNTFEGFNYFPNPVKDVLTLDSPRPIDNVEIFNMLGQRIIAVDSQNTIQNIDMSNVQAGAYIVKVSIGDQTKAIRVIKE